MERLRKTEVESLRHQPAAVQPQQQAPEHAQQMCVKEFGMCARAAAHLQREAPSAPSVTGTSATSSCSRAKDSLRRRRAYDNEWAVNALRTISAKLPGRMGRPCR